MKIDVENLLEYLAITSIEILISNIQLGHHIRSSLHHPYLTYLPLPVAQSWRHYTVSGLPCRRGTTCAQNAIGGHWACEPEGGEIGEFYNRLHREMLHGTPVVWTDVLDLLDRYIAVSVAGKKAEDTESVNLPGR